MNWDLWGGAVLLILPALCLWYWLFPLAFPRGLLELLTGHPPDDDAG